MFEFSSTYSANPSAAFSSGSMSVSSASSSFSASSSLGSSFRSSVGTTAAPISVRTSDKTLRSFSSGGGVGSYTSSGSGSFISIHNEVSSGLSSPITSLPLAAGSDLRLRFSLDSVLLPVPQGPVQAVRPLFSHL